jgi:hypothetical protein
MVAILMIALHIDAISETTTSTSSVLTNIFYVETLLLSIIYWLPVLNPLVTLFTVKKYRQVIWNFVRHRSTALIASLGALALQKNGLMAVIL